MGESEVGRSSWGGGATGVCVRAYERTGVRGRRCVWLRAACRFTAGGMAG